MRAGALTGTVFPSRSCRRHMAVGAARVQPADGQFGAFLDGQEAAFHATDRRYGHVERRRQFALRHAHFLAQAAQLVWLHSNHQSSIFDLSPPPVAAGGGGFRYLTVISRIFTTKRQI